MRSGHISIYPRAWAAFDIGGGNCQRGWSNREVLSAIAETRQTTWAREQMSEPKVMNPNGLEFDVLFTARVRASRVAGRAAYFARRSRMSDTTFARRTCFGDVNLAWRSDRASNVLRLLGLTKQDRPDKTVPQ